MPKVWFSKLGKRSSQAGFSMVEVLLAASIFAFLVTGLIGALVYGNTATDIAGDRNRAVMLADEGIQAVRNIRDAGYANLSDGTYGLAQSGGTWTLSGSSDTSGAYTRQVTVASNGTDRKNITSTVTWQDANGASRQVAVQSMLSNWMASIKSWLNAIRAGSLDAASTQDALKVATAGNYAYVVRNGGTPSLLVVNISNPASPTLAGSLTLAANPTSIAVSGNYAYVTTSSDTAELQIVNISNPAAPSLTSSYNAAGAANGQGVFVSGNYAYVSRGANSGSAEFIIVNVSNPASPTLAGSYGNNVSMLDVVVKGNYAYVGTSTGVVLVINVTNPAAPSLTLSQTQTTTGAVNALKIFNNTLLIGQSTTMSVLDITTQTSPVRRGSVTTTGSAAVRGIDVDPTNQYAFLGTTNTTAELQIVNISTLTAPVIVKTVDVSGTASTIYGVAYNTTIDTLIAATASDTQEVITFIEN